MWALTTFAFWSVLCTALPTGLHHTESARAAVPEASLTTTTTPTVRGFEVYDIGVFLLLVVDA